MLKNTDRYNNPTHFSYKDYKQKVNKKSNKDITIFISVFIIGVLIILGFAKILSPNVDVGIADESEYSQQDDDMAKTIVDERLKNLQMEDAGKKLREDEMFSPELDEKVILPKQLRKTVGEMEAEIQNAKIQQQKAEEANKKPEETTSSQPAQITNARVVVGYYATEKQAEVAKSIIQDSGAGVTPIVKNMGNYYTLQVGSYSSKDKAQQAANNLLKSNFPARVVVE